jgi:hypothetical protein
MMHYSRNLQNFATVGNNVVNKFLILREYAWPDAFWAKIPKSPNSLCKYSLNYSLNGESAGIGFEMVIFNKKQRAQGVGDSYRR